MAGIMRNAQSVDFGSQQVVGAPQDATAYMNPNYAKFSNTEGRLGTHTDLRGSALDGLVGALAPVVSQLGEKMMKDVKAEAFLKGQAAAASGQAQDQIDANILTRGWAQEGWKDTKARLAVADADAQAQADLKAQRELSPEDYSAYLDKRRSDMMSQISDAPVETQRALVGQMLTSDRQLIAKQATQHAAFIIDQKSKAFTTSYSVANDTLNASKNDPVAYAKAADNQLMNLVGMLSNPTLPQDVKEKLMTEAMQRSLADNNQVVYEKARDMKDANGVSLLDTIGFDAQVKLAKAYQTSRQDTAAMRNSEYNTRLGLYEARLADPNSPPVTFAENKAMIDEGIQNGTVTGEKAISLNKAWAEHGQQYQRAASGGEAYARGDTAKMFELGISEEQGAQAWMAAMRRQGATPDQIVAQSLQIGVTTGQASAFAVAGKMLTPAINSIGSGQNINPSQLASLTSLFNTLDLADRKGNKLANSQFLNSLPEEQRAKVIAYRMSLRKNNSPEVAAADAAKQQEQTANMTPAERNAAANQSATENAKMLADMAPQGLVSQLVNAVVPDVFRRSGAARDSLRVKEGIFENSFRAAEAQATATAALQAELSSVTQMYPLMPKEGRFSLAVANVARRSVNTGGSIVVVPEHTTPQQYFGVPESVSPEVIGAALGAMHKPSNPDNRVVFSTDSTGGMNWREYSKDGRTVLGSGAFDPKQVGPFVQHDMDERTAKFQRTDGTGVNHTGPNGERVNYNGNNTIGIGTNVALQVRDDLVKMEGVRDTPYNDASGKIVNGTRVQTVGVGISTTNKFYPKVGPDGRVTSQDISDSFMKASNAAMIQANDATQGLPKQLHTPSTLRLFTQLAYQGGSVPRDLVNAMAHGNRDEAMRLLLDSPQYKMAHPDRRVFYTDLMRGIMPFN